MNKQYMSQLRIGHKIATLVDGNLVGISYIYKSLLANQPTPPKMRYDRKQRFAAAWGEDGEVRAVRTARLFKGHRP
jgi:hypothetical protein